jgi:hypothetical protein
VTQSLTSLGMAPMKMMDLRTKSKSEQVLAKEGGHVS